MKQQKYLKLDVGRDSLHESLVYRNTAITTKKFGIISALCPPSGLKLHVYRFSRFGARLVQINKQTIKIFIL